MSGLIYMVRKEKLWKENTIKIGMSFKCTLDRVKSYGKDTIIYHVQKVHNPKRLETIIKTEFVKKFKLESGQEFFRGNIEEMVSFFKVLTNKYIEEVPKPEKTPKSEETPKPEESRDAMVCEYCGKILLHIHNYEKHIEKHKKEILDEENNESTILKKKIVVLEEELKIEKETSMKYLAENNALKYFLSQGMNKSTIITNNYTTNTDNSTNKTQIINNLLPLTDEHMKEQSENFTMDHFKRGAVGISDYAVEYPLKDRIVCVDVARHIVKYKNADGDIIKDPNMCKLTPKIFSSIYDKSREFVINMANDISDKTDPCSIADENVKNAELDMEFFRTYKGHETPMRKEFVRNICAKVSN